MDLPMAGKEKRTYNDRREYIIQAVQKRRKKIRKLAAEYKGGKCQQCGYDRCLEALDFHHIDPTKKDFAISSKGYTRSWEKVKNELDKCIMLCANCHREIHVKLAALKRNLKVKSGLSQGNLKSKHFDQGNPELSRIYEFLERESAETLHPLPKQKCCG